MNKIPKSFIFSILLIFVCVSRLIPHPFNFSPVGSIFLMSPILLKNRNLSFLISLIPLFISDILINKIIYNSENLIYDGFLWIYFSYFLIWLYSIKITTKQNLLTKSFVGSLIFFFITNASCWYNNLMYSQNLFGLIESYIAGIPFYWNTLAGFIFYTYAIFFISKFIEKKIYKFDHQLV